MSDTSPSETDGKNNENNQSIDESGDKIYGLKFKKKIYIKNEERRTKGCKK